MPTASSFPSGSSSGLKPGGGGGSGIIVTILLVVGILVFAALTIVLYAKYTAEVKSVNDQKTAAAKAAATAQQSLDDVAATKAAESPFRPYTAPVADGSFIINFPKDWSSYVDSERAGIQVMLVLNPNFVTRTNGVDDPDATRVSLQEQTGTQFLTQFAGLIQQHKLTQTSTTVSGQPAYDVTGQFSDKKTVREVIVPVRDKVVVFSSENAKYATEFTEILAQAKINP